MGGCHPCPLDTVVAAVERTPPGVQVLDETGGFVNDFAGHPPDRLQALDERLVVRTAPALMAEEHPRFGVGATVAEVVVIVEAPGHPEPQRTPVPPRLNLQGADRKARQLHPGQLVPAPAVGVGRRPRGPPDEKVVVLADQPGELIERADRPADASLRHPSSVFGLSSGEGDGGDPAGSARRPVDRARGDPSATLGRP